MEAMKKKDAYCQLCGTNLTAREREKNRRREYMQKYRKKIVKPVDKQ